MGIRIQPLDIEVPKYDPFEYDLLGRKEQVEVLTNLVANIEGPCVFAVDAAWGNGKTTFIKIWSQYLRNKGFPVVQLNAWETDFSGSPFVAIASGMTQGIKEYTGHTQTETIENLKRGAKEVLRGSAPWVAQGIGGAIPIVGPVVGSILSVFTNSLLENQPKAEKSIQDFKDSLKGLAPALSEGRPVVVFVDELDRCRPTYAIEFLEVAKHLFAVDNVVFILAVNQEQLAHSVKAVYGNDFDADGYLRRFFDVDYRLPNPDRSAFIHGLMNATGIYDYLQGSNVTNRRILDPELVSRVLQQFLGLSELGLRDIARAIHRLGLVFLSLPSEARALVNSVIVAFVIRTIDKALYDRFTRGEATDQEVVERIFARMGGEVHQVPSIFDWVEGTIILGALELEGNSHEAGDSINTPLYNQYKTLLSGTPSNSSQTNHAKAVIGWIEKVRSSSQFPEPTNLYLDSNDFRFNFAVQRLELISREFIPAGDEQADLPTN